MPANPSILDNLKKYVADKTGGNPPIGGGGGDDPNPNRIPLPNYKDAASRLAYAKAFRQKYGQSLTGYGDIPLRVNEKPWWGSDTSKNLAVKYGSAVGLNPALFYSSSMIEGQSGLYSGAEKALGANTVQFTGDSDYPVSGLWNFGLDSFQDYLPTLKKKGYLPADFDKNFKIWNRQYGPGGPGTRGENELFKTTDAAIQAKAAMLRAYYDETDDYAKQKGYTLTPAQRDFFALAHFNSGKHGFQMLDAYNKAGLLNNEDFISKQPNIPIEGVSPRLHKEIFDHIAPRLAAARGLIGEGLFEDQQKPKDPATVTTTTAAN